MKKRLTAVMLAAVFALSTTACAKDIREVLDDTDEVTVEASVESSVDASVEAPAEASSEVSIEEEEEKPAPATEETSEEATEESSEEKEDTDNTKPLNTGGVTTDKRYENSEFNVAVVIDNDMRFSGEKELAALTEDEKDTELPKDVNPLVEALNYYNITYLAHATSRDFDKEIYVKTADLSDKMVYSESAFAAMSSVRLKVQLQDSFDTVDTWTDEITVLGETHNVVKIEISTQGIYAYMAELYLIKDGRIMIISVFATSDDEINRIYSNLETLNS